MTDSTSLPAGFEDLEGYVAEWALATQQERNDQRCRCTFKQLEDFYAVMIGRIREIAKHLDGFPINALPQDSVRLMFLGQMLMEIAPAVEVMKTVDVPADYPRERLIIHLQTQQYALAS